MQKRKDVKLRFHVEGEEELETTVKSLQEVHTRYLADYQKHIGSRSSGVQLEPGIEFSVWPNIRRNGAAIGRIKLESARTQSVQQKTVAKTKDVLSAFDRLVSTQRKALKEAGREMDEAELVKLCQGLWSNMSNSEKDYYETLATKSDGQVKPNAAQPGEATTPRSANSGVQGFAEKNLCFNALNELTWQEILIETLKRIDRKFIRTLRFRKVPLIGVQQPSQASRRSTFKLQQLLYNDVNGAGDLEGRTRWKDRKICLT